RPELGRTFEPSDYTSGNSRLAVLSHVLWETRFGGDPGIVGKTIMLDNAAHTVLGVMPRGFYPTRWEDAYLWLPLTMDPAVKQSRVLWKLFTFARLKPGITFDQAQREMEVISDRLTAAYPENYDNMTAVLTPVAGYLFSQYEKLFYTLLGAVGLVLLIACADVAALLLARSTERHRELAVRAALGASRGRLVWLVLTESLILSLGGAALGTALAFGFVRPVTSLLPAASRVPRIAEVALDWHVLAFTLGISLLAGLLFGILPALRASRPNLNESLKEAGRSGSAGAAAKRAGDILIVGEVAVSLVLLAGAGLLIRSFVQLLRTDPGFNPDRVLALSFGVPTHRYGKYETGGLNSTRARLFADIERRMLAVPGVRSAAVTGLLPLRHGPNPWAMHIEGKPAPPPNRNAYGGAARNKTTGLYNHGDVSIERVTPGYFKTFGIPLVRGRYFDVRDDANAPKVALVNETVARRYFGADDPIGRTIIIDMTSYFPRMTVVGVVADSRLNALDKEAYPEVFWPMAQLPSAGGWVTLRTAADPVGLARAAQAAMRELDPDIAIGEVTTMKDVLQGSLWRQRLTAVLLATFAGLSLALAAAGIYGVFSYLVNRRTKELGVRVALGASKAQILSLVLGSSLKLAVLGIGIGTAGAFMAGRLMSSWLYGVQANDALTFASVAVLLLLIALAACYIPAARATRVDPVIALRDH
ncbi:MAG TPA: ABC transporter permease, partial [Candidatus Acidoferrales bacterium]|nr:ABC transporter permease [Candidatus Acidoferrales bacterium]